MKNKLNKELIASFINIVRGLDSSNRVKASNGLELINTADSLIYDEVCRDHKLSLNYENLETFINELDDRYLTVIRRFDSENAEVILDVIKYCTEEK